MKLLLVHNYYQQSGGEDGVCEAEKDLLLGEGHRVAEYTRCNAEISEPGVCRQLTLGLRTIWAWDSVSDLRPILRREKPDLAHFHNTFPLISPAAYYACRETGVPVVQTVHNYRLLCPAATLFRNGHVCEDCVQHSVWRAVRYGCYRASRPATTAASLMLTVHRWRQTWTRMVDCYVVPTQFARRKFVEGGFPGEKIFVKPHLVHPDPGPRESPGEYALFVGRMSAEKGLNTLLRAWSLLGNRVPLRILGDGPSLSQWRAKAILEGLASISFEGHKSYAEVFAAMRSARFLVFPSHWYETFGRTIAEAFACGLPVVASRLGAMQEIVEDGRTGLHFTPAEPEDLAAKIAWAWANPGCLAEMGREARREYETKYSAERNYSLLMEIYQRTLASRNQA